MSSSVSGSRSPGLAHTCSRELAQLAGLDVRTIQRLKRRAIATPHERNRGLLTLITAHLAARQLQAWGLDPPHGPLEQIATYLDHRGSRDSTDTCVICGRDLIGQQQLYCSPRCSKRAYRARREATPETPPYASGNTSQPPMPAAETGAMSMAGGISPPSLLNP